MGNGIIFNNSAFDHDVTEESIRYVLRHPRYEGLLEGEVCRR
jgi:hypothetical protein